MIPITAPPVREVYMALFIEFLAAKVVFWFAIVATNIPIKPLNIDKKEPIIKEIENFQENRKNNNRAIEVTNGAKTVYSLFR